MKTGLEKLKDNIYKEVIYQGGDDELAFLVSGLMKTKEQANEMIDWLISNRNTQLTRDYPLIKAIKIHNSN